jgi:hypothetical protein
MITTTCFVPPGAVRRGLLCAAVLLLVACGGARQDGGPSAAGEGTGRDAVTEQASIEEGARLNREELASAEAQEADDPALRDRRAAARTKAAASTVPVYRFFNGQTRAHFYTTSVAERDQIRATLSQFQYEGAAFSAVAAPAEGLSPVHRFYNTVTGVHFYTISEDERSQIQARLPQFRYEGVAYYASKVAATGFIPLYRFYLTARGFHFYSASHSEAALVRTTMPQYADEGVGYHVPGVPEQVAGVSNPILFVTQVPHTADFAARMSSFGNHLARPDHVPRGGDLYIRYPDGTLRNLTREAGFGSAGMQGAAAIAVREPSVHWNGQKALFSMIVGGPATRYQVGTYYWQIYEVEGLGRGETVSIRKIANQPATYNNISPFYGTDDRILFTSDRPRGGESHLYPQLDEYESTATVTGLWSLDPVSGELRLLNHAPSGVFSPTLDSAGRIVFTRWDHLQQDQQADAQRAGQAQYGAITFASEAPGAASLGLTDELFPEKRQAHTGPFGRVAGYTNNFFTPWQINEDGSDEETLNHVGRHELSFSYLGQSFLDDPALTYYVSSAFHANTKNLRGDGGLFHIREEPARPGHFVAVNAREFGSLTTNQIVRFNGGDGANPDAMLVTDVTAPAGNDGAIAGGRFRNPLPLASGTLLATHTPTAAATPSQMTQLLIKPLVAGTGGLLQAGVSLTGGIRKSVSWWDPDTLRSFDGLMWELEAVEVVARLKPPMRQAPPLAAPERQIFTEEAVDEAQLRNWLRANDLALIITRNQTTRDRADQQQPYNLRVPGGVSTVAPGGGRVYDIAHFQLFQGDLVRGYRFAGRRVLAVPMHEPRASMPANAGGPVSSVRIAPDGSTAAFVPARRALTWQTTDGAGYPVVRERVWVTFQPGEVRLCASCHGVNTQSQAASLGPTNPPEALRTLLRHWKTLP